jgi:hypothetical protein
LTIIASVLLTASRLLPMMRKWLNPKEKQELGYVATAAGRSSWK